MRVVLQRVRSAAVEVDGEVVGAIGPGLLLLVGVHGSDSDATAGAVADKIAVLRIFNDADGKMNLSAGDVGSSMLVVSQFTLFGDVRRGRRPSFSEAAPAELGEHLYRQFGTRLAEHGFPVEWGQFGAHMLVRLENDGPVTLIIDSGEL